MPAGICADLIFPAIVDGAQRLGALDDKSVGEQTYELFDEISTSSPGPSSTRKSSLPKASWSVSRQARRFSRLRTVACSTACATSAQVPSPNLSPTNSAPPASRKPNTPSPASASIANSKISATNGYDAVRNRHTGILGFLETGLYGTASSAGYTAVAMIPVAGPYLAMSAAMSDTYTDLKLKYPKATSSDLRKVAVVSGAFRNDGAVQSPRHLRKGPRFERAMNRWANPAFVGGAQRAGKRLVTTLAAENAMEAAQDLTTPLVQDVCAALGMDIPGVNWKGGLWTFRRARPETFAALVPMVVLGVFGISMHENRRLQSQPERLKIWQSVGFNNEQIAEIERGGTVEEKQAKARELLNQRTPEAIDEGIRMVEAEQDAANVAHLIPSRRKRFRPAY